MMRRLLLVVFWLLPSSALADDELITVRSAHSAFETVLRLREAIVAKGWTILSTVDHAAHAASYGVKIPARTTIAFAYMGRWLGPVVERPTLAIEVPDRVLVWEDHEGVWVTRNTLRYYIKNVLGRHDAKVPEGALQVHDAMVAAMIDMVTR
jgi:uncharacterized protein (DUF302 family)